MKNNKLVKKIVLALCLLLASFNLYAADPVRMGTYIVEYRDYDRPWQYETRYPQYKWKEIQRKTTVDMPKEYLVDLFPKTYSRLEGYSRITVFENGSLQIWNYQDCESWDRVKELEESIWLQNEDDEIAYKFLRILRNVHSIGGGMVS
jgi:hypothetical protein